MRAGIVGVGGYTGLELVKILLNHPKFDLVYTAATSQNQLNAIFPMLKGICDMQVEIADPNEIKKRCDIVFLALPHTQGMAFAKELIGSVKIVDLSADYRVSKENYEKNYCEHLDTQNLKNAVYGLVELNRENIKNANLVANPGCYPTCSILAITPFAKLLDDKFGVMIDAKSGVSGAGKSLKASSHFVSVNENINAYSPLSHRHSDEIMEHLNKFGESDLDVFFVPNLIPVTRGMLVSAFGMLKPEFADINPLEILNKFYKDEKFVRITDEAVSIKNVVGTHFCDIFAINKNGRIWINSAIDNLLKGASSQAVANANLICGFDEELGMPYFGNCV
nr:N-acetyl-gamma-glutamyl-phosphate reductase [Campylobacter sp.]